MSSSILNANPRLAPSEVHATLSNIVRFDRHPGDQTRQGRMLRQCLEHALDANAVDEAGIGLLHGQSSHFWTNGLCDEGRAFYAAILLDHGADLEIPDSQEGLRPLAWAARYGRKALVDLFLSRGAKVEVKGEKAESNGQKKER